MEPRFSYTYPHLLDYILKPFISILLRQGNKKENGRVKEGYKEMY
jgi:hypothetical protein